jgi:hypothetical protein
MPPVRSIAFRSRGDPQRPHLNRTGGIAGLGNLDRLLEVIGFDDHVPGEPFALASKRPGADTQASVVIAADPDRSDRTGVETFDVEQSARLRQSNHPIVGAAMMFDLTLETLAPEVFGFNHHQYEFHVAPWSVAIT